MKSGALNRQVALTANEAARNFDIKLLIGDTVRNYSIEILPREAEKRIAIGPSNLPPGTRVYIAYTSGGPDDVVNAAQIVHESGHVPVPHIPARRFAGEAELRAFIEGLAKRASVRQVLLIGGDNAQSAGPFQSTMDILRTGFLQGNGIRTLGFAGHPDGHPVISEGVLRAALLEKHAFAAKWGMEFYLVTQFLFDTEKLFAWHSGFIERTLPDVSIDIGLPGLAKPATLLRFAKECGVSASLGMLTKNPLRALKLASSFSPEEPLIDLAIDTRQGGRPWFRSVHFFPFGSFERTTQWLQMLATGTFRVDEAARSIDPI